MPQVRHEVQPTTHPDAKRPLWHVVGISDNTRYMVGQPAINERIIYFQTRNFYSGSVTLLVADATPEAVAAAIEPEAMRLEQTGALRSPH